MDYIMTTLGNLVHQTAFFNLTAGNLIMIGVACFFFACISPTEPPSTDTS